MAKVYRGTGGSMPVKGVFEKENLFYETVQGPHGDRQKKLGFLALDSGEKNRPLVILDPHLDYSINIHVKYQLNGSWNNYAVCLDGLDGRGCPLCRALKKRKTWVVPGTVIDLKPWTPTEGKNAGNTYKDFRRLVFFPAAIIEALEAVEDDVENDWRGQHMRVTRSTNEKAYRVGDVWNINHKRGKMSDEEMWSEFADAAIGYGLPVEAFCRPINYDVSLAPRPWEELDAQAKLIAGTSQESRFDNRSGIASAPPPSAPAKPRRALNLEKMDDEDGDDLPF